jgi:ABC-type uncharacterized transport system ATPase subunit
MIIQLNNIVKEYSHKTVLKQCSYTFESGKIYALLGENGAGKSTLANIISGQIPYTSGTITVNKKKVVFSHPSDAQHFAIEEVCQRPLLADVLSVKENIMLGHEHSKKAKLILTELSNSSQSPALLQIPLDKPVWQLSAPERFFTSFAAVLTTEPKFLILDEPGSSLDTEQRNVVYKYLNYLTEKGMGILIISHNRLEALKIADTVLELKNGKIYPVKHFVQNENLDDAIQVTLPHIPFTSIAFSINKITVRPINRAAIFDISCTVPTGTLTAICGQRENGLETLENCITGMSNTSHLGNFTLFGNTFTKLNPHILRKSGVAIIFFDRNFRGSNPNLTIQQMLSIYTDTVKYKKELALSIIKKAGINIQLNEKVKNLSGGMLQRLIAFRELETKPRLLIVCNPTRGMDLKSSQNFVKLLVKTAKNGTAILALTESSSILAKSASTVYNLIGGHLSMAPQDSIIGSAQ